jgi:hypothetical protein
VQKEELDMLVAIGALLGVPVWILLGWLAGGLWHRHEIKQIPDLFKTKVRMVSGTFGHTDDTFPRLAGHAVMAHDILILEKGMLIPRTIVYRITDGVQPPQPADPDKIKGLGDKPVTIQFRLDGGEVIELAAQGEDLDDARGPFFTNDNKNDQ